MNQARFQKQQREKARREKTAAKQARLEERRSGQGAAQAAAPPDAADQDAVLAELAELHRRFDEDEIEFEDFVAAKDELTARLDIR